MPSVCAADGICACALATAALPGVASPRIGSEYWVEVAPSDTAAVAVGAVDLAVVDWKELISIISDLTEHVNEGVCVLRACVSE